MRPSKGPTNFRPRLYCLTPRQCRQLFVDNLLLCSSSRCNRLVLTAKVLNALGNWGLSLTLQSTKCFHHCQLHGIASHSQIKIIPAQRLQALTQIPRPQTKRKRLSLLGLLNLFQIWVPNFALHAKSLYQATQENLDESLLAPHLSPHSNTDSYQTFTTGPFSLLTWLHQAFFPFCTFSTRTCFRDSVPNKRGDIWGPLAYLSKQLDLVMLRWPPVSRP